MDANDIPGVIVCVVIFCVFWVLFGGKKKRLFKPPNLHGAAEWAKDKMLAIAGYFGRRGIPIGFTKSGKTITVGGDRHRTHFLTFGGTGKGKTTNAIIPALLTWLWSAIVIDIGGEAVATSGHYRRKFGRVVVWDPTILQMTGPKDSNICNGMRWVRNG